MLQQLTDVLYTPPRLAAIDASGPAPEAAHGRCTTTQQHRSPAASLLASDEAAAIVEQIAGNQERCLQGLFFLDALTLALLTRQTLQPSRYQADLRSLALPQRARERLSIRRSLTRGSNAGGAYDDDGNGRYAGRFADAV